MNTAAEAALVLPAPLVAAMRKGTSAYLPVRNDSALLADDSPDLAAFGTGVEVLLRFLLRQPLY